MSTLPPDVPDVLAALGWAAFAPSFPGSPGTHPARVVAQHRGRFDLLGASGPRSGLLRGALRDEPPVVGDWVAARELGDGQALIEARLPRATVIRRRRVGGGDAQEIAANVDRVAVVTSPDDLNARRLERYLAVARGAGCEARIVLAKADLLDGPAPPDALAVSARDGTGIEALRAWIGGATVALLGSSGVGKSSLLNALLGGDVRSVGAVRASDGRGQHTTTSRDLLLLPGGGCAIDTPGMRELGLSVDADPDEAFDALSDLAVDCRWRDCSHTHEPGCAVRAAVEAGTLDEGALASWERLRRELRWEREREDTRARRQRFRAFSKARRSDPKGRWDPGSD